MNASDTRAQQRQRWIDHHLGKENTELRSASMDASFRSYWRLRDQGRSLILMDAPPEREPATPRFVDVAKRLRRAGLNAPRIHHADLKQGFLLIDDLGSTLYSDAFDQADALYQTAINALVRMQTIDTEGLPSYDAASLETEMDLFRDWLLHRHLGRQLSAEFESSWAKLKQLLIDAVSSQPQVFVHRDYHCRNLMVTDGNNPGIIDFQDAAAGPITYDLVSLLRDAYVRWSPERIDRWLEQARLNTNAAHRVDRDTWQRWFDWMGLQRQLKVAGIFCRLNYRDGKADYMKDIPLTLSYAVDASAKYPELSCLHALLCDVAPLMEPQ